MLLTFSQNLTLYKEAFETAAQMHEELIRTEFDGAFCQKFKLLVDRFSSFLRNTPYPSFSNRIAFPYLAYFSEIVAIYCMISTDRKHRLVYSISLLKQVRFITTEQDLSLVTRFMLSSLELIKCMPFSRKSVPKFGTLFLIRLNYLNVRLFVKR